VTILDLATHPFAFVTINELAEYWRITPAQVLEVVDSGHLEAIEFGGGARRVMAQAALEFERRARVRTTTPTWGPVLPWPQSAGSQTPKTRKRRAKP
jgi:hypothetical protein